MDTSYHCTTETGYTFDAVSHQILGSPCADQNTEAVDYGLEARGSGGFALIPSAPRTNGSPSVPLRSSTLVPEPSSSISHSETPAQQTESGVSSPQSDSTPITLQTVPSAFEPTALDPTAPIGTNATPASSALGNATRTPVMQSTDHGLRPIPPAATQVGDPNGHHEITEPNFTATRPCRRCSPVIEITATGWLENPAEEQHGTSEGHPQQVTVSPPKVTLPVGSSNILISQKTSGGNFVVGDSTTLTPGQTITVNDTPIAIQTSEGRTDIIVGTTVVPLKPDVIQSQTTGEPQVTAAPVLLPPVLTLGTKAITPNAQTQYIIAGQTLAPGGSEVVVSGTTLSLAPSATAIVINGETSSLTPLTGGIYTTTVPGALTFKDHVYTTNRAGWIVMGPSTTLIPGGPAVTVDGTTLSLEHSGTAVTVQGTTMALQPVTTVVTLTRSLGTGGGVGGGIAGQKSTGDGYVYSTGKPVPGIGTLQYGHTSTDGWLAGCIVLIWVAFGSFAIRL